MRYILEYLGIIRRKYRDRKNISDEIQTIIPLIKNELKISIEKVNS